jgi:D-aminopeptidase
MFGLARTGSDASNGSGDYAIAFSTAASVRRNPAGGILRALASLQDDAVSPLFQAVIEATEEAIYNSMLRATSVTTRGRTVEALPIDSVRAILARFRAGDR